MARAMSNAADGPQGTGFEQLDGIEVKVLLEYGIATRARTASKIPVRSPEVHRLCQH